MKQRENTNLGFFLKITCLFILLGLGFIGRKNYLSQGKKEISLVVKSNSGLAQLPNYIWVVKK
jgi:hypothetical protein